MIKKGIALTTLACFLLFSYSCAIRTWQKVEIESLKPKDKQSAKISAAQLLSGEHIDFSKKPPAHIVGERIVGDEGGFDDVRREIRISKSEVDQVDRSEDGQVIRIKTKDGRVYSADETIRVNNDAYFVRLNKKAIYIPLQDVKYVWVKKVNVSLTILLYLTPLVLLYGISWLALSAWSERPFFSH